MLEGWRFGGARSLWVMGKGKITFLSFSGGLEVENDI